MLADQRVRPNIPVTYSPDASVAELTGCQTSPTTPRSVAPDGCRNRARAMPPLAVLRPAPQGWLSSPGCRPSPPQQPERLAFRAELLHAVVAELAQVHVPLVASRYQQCRRDSCSLPGSLPLFAPDLDELGLAAAGVEHLHAVVAGVGHPQPVVLVDRHLLRPHELRPARSPCLPHCQQELPRRARTFGCGRIRRIRRCSSCLRILHGVGDEAKLARRRGRWCRRWFDP